MMRINLVITNLSPSPNLEAEQHHREGRIESVSASFTDHTTPKPCPPSGKCKQPAA